MQKQNLSPLDQDIPTIIRTKNLILAENIILITLFTGIVWAIFMANIPLYGTFPIFLGPVVYTLLWRYRSIQYETVNPKQTLQSGVTIIFFIWSFLMTLLLLPYAFSSFIFSISQGFSFYKATHFIPVLATTSFAFYLLKSFAISIKIDAKKPSLK